MGANTPSADRHVATIDELIAACRDTGTRRVIVNGKLDNAPSIRLAPVTLSSSRVVRRRRSRSMAA